MESSRQPFFMTRGVVLLPSDLTLADWPERARQAGLTTVALHDGVSPQNVARFVESEPVQRFLEQCRRFGLQVEYELHALRELLPRELFSKDPVLFRMNEQGERTPDANLCVHSERALEIVEENAVVLSRRLRPTTGRYFLWWDDAQPGCRCPRCVPLSDSDQALILENRLLRALRREDAAAQLAHLAYAHTYSPPTQIRPEPGVFLEFAPIERRYDTPFDSAEQRKHQETLDANLAVFGSEGAQALEYWLDVSRFSGWKRPAVRLPFDGRIFAADLDAYRARGIRHITTFAAWIDADYAAKYGDPPLEEYGAFLMTPVE